MVYREELEKAKIKIRENNIEEGKAILEKLIGEGIEDKDIYLEIGKCYIDRDNDKAIKNIGKYVELGGEDINVKILLAKMYKLKGETGKSRDILEGIKEKNKEGLIELFRINVIEGKKEKAIKNIEEIDNKYKGEIREIEEIVKECIKWGEYEILEGAIKNNKDYIDCEKYHYYLYECYKGIGDKEKIIREIEYLKGKKEYEKEIKEELIRESEKEVEDLGESIYKLIEIICEYIEEDDTDSDIIRALAILLRKNMYDKQKKGKIIEILERYRKASKKPRAGNIFLNEKEILEKKVVLESKPRHITVELTARCNLKCLMCGFSDVADNKKTDVSDSFLDFFRSNIQYFERIVWQGGEPFLYDKIFDLVDLAKKNNVYQQISTNFLLPNDKNIKQLCDEKITLSVSIDGITKDIYEKIRVGGNFELLIRNLSVLKKHKENKRIKTIMAVVVMPINFAQIDDMVKFAINYGFDEINFQKYIKKRDIDLDLNSEQLDFVLKRIELYEKQSLCSEIPIKVSTAFEYEKECVNTETNECRNECEDIKEDIKYNEKQREIVNEKFFCYAPWTNLCLYTNNILKIACNSIDIICKGTEIWNNRELIKYRQMIADKNLMLCREDCANRGFESFSIKMGI